MHPLDFTIEPKNSRAMTRRESSLYLFLSPFVLLFLSRALPLATIFFSLAFSSLLFLQLPRAFYDRK